MPAMTYFPAPAKLNLFLHVIGRRADGYHLLQTVFRLIDFNDQVGVAPRADGAIRRVNAVAGVPEEDDLALRAARLLKTETGIAKGADIEIVKRLPLGGGVGGGSSDAATALMALNELWATGLTHHQLIHMAARLGADVPFFVFGESAFAEGVGEVLTPVALAPAWYLLLMPDAAISTAEIFGDPALARDTPAIAAADYEQGWGRNALQPIACARYPVVAKHLEWLSKYGDARMTGSGACVFVGFSSQSAALEVLAKLPSGMRGVVARGLERHPMYEQAGRR